MLKQGKGTVGIITDTQVRILKAVSPGEPKCCTGTAYAGKSKLTMLLGDNFWASIGSKVVVDFGCGEGADAVEMAIKGAKQVIGIDIREEVLIIARRRAAEAGVSDKCVFATSIGQVAGIDQLADMVVSLDSFEHFADPTAILREADRMLKAEGEIVASFGPTWYHPLGGHLFSVFPWAHLIFSEAALIRWRADFKSDGATRFSGVAGGLNQMTIRRFEQLVAGSPFRFASLELVPIRRLAPIHNRMTREFTTALIRCRLVKKVTELELSPPMPLVQATDWPEIPSHREWDRPKRAAASFGTKIGWPVGRF